MSRRILPFTGMIRLDYTASKNLQVARAVADFSATFVNTPYHVKLESALDGIRLLGLQTIGRPQRAVRCLAPAATGKTTVAMRYASRINASVPKTEDRIPILYVTIQNSSTPRRLMISMLEALNAPAAERGTQHLLKRRLMELLKYHRVEIIIMDEIHHLAQRRNVNEVINTLKAFLNDCVCPLAFLGTDDAARIFTTNAELMQRIHTVADIAPLPKNPTGLKAMAKFLSELDAELLRLGIFARGSAFTSEFIVSGLMRVAGGVMGAAARILQKALEISIRRNASLIEMYDVIEAIDTWAIPNGYCKTNPFYEA